MKTRTPSDSTRSERRAVVSTIHSTPSGVSLDSQNYPLELLAVVAARLLEGSDYTGAVERAVALLNACKEYQEQSVRNKTLLDKIGELSEARDAGERAAKRVPFSSALEKIYGRSRMGRNLEYHYALTGYKLGFDEPRVLEKVISLEMERGFLIPELEGLAREYKSIPSAEWRAIVAEHKRHRTPPENKIVDRQKKRSSGKKPLTAGK